MHFVYFRLISLHHYIFALAWHILLLHIFMLLVWTSHWWFRCALALVPMWEWMFYNSRYFSWYYCNYCFEKWNSKKGSHLFLGHTWWQVDILIMKNNFWTLTNLVIVDPTHLVCIIHDNTCNNNCHSGKNVIICGAHIRKWLHSHYHKNLWLFSLSFQLLLDFLWSATIACHEWSSLVPYFLLLVVCVHNLSTCTSHCNLLMWCHIEKTFLNSFTHHG